MIYIAYTAYTASSYVLFFILRFYVGQLSVYNFDLKYTWIIVLLICDKCPLLRIYENKTKRKV